MKVPFLDLARSQASEKETVKALLAEVVDSGQFLFGPRLAEFERALAADLGVEADRVVACHSGTDALMLSLIGAGVGSGDEVITVPNTAIATAAAIVATGARPVFADVSERTHLLCAESMVRAITPRTRAVVPVHLYGNIVDIPALRAALVRAGRSDIVVVEDAAQAQGGFLGASPVGTLGDFSAFSFFPTKNLGAMGDGGALIARDPEGAARCRALRFYGQRERNFSEITRGLNSRMDEFQASVLSLRIRSLRANIERKERLLLLYREALARTELRLPESTGEARPAWHLCVVVTPDEPMRDSLRAHLARSGVDTLVHYPHPLHRQPAFCASESATAALPIAEALARRILSLPFSAYHTDEEIAFVAQSVSDWARR